jgi:hypothetical protein
MDDGRFLEREIALVHRPVTLGQVGQAFVHGNGLEKPAHCAIGSFE